MKYYQDPINGKFYPADREEKQLQALEEAQARAKKEKEAKTALMIWFVNGFLIGFEIVLLFKIFGG